MIVEDQIPAQRILKRYIKDLPTLELIATCGDCLKAVEQLNMQSIDLIFLDINLPKISGLNFLRSLSNPPLVIITSAYPQYAVEGFELDVIDYLLKPFSFERFLKATFKAMQRRSGEQVQAVEEPGEQFVFVKSDKEIHRVNFGEILFIQSEGDFVKVITTQKRHFLYQTLKYWNSILPVQYFVQVHKSYIVNLSKIDSIRGNQIKVDQSLIPIGRSFRQAFLEKVLGK